MCIFKRQRQHWQPAYFCQHRLLLNSHFTIFTELKVPNHTNFSWWKSSFERVKVVLDLNHKCSRAHRGLRNCNFFFYFIIIPILIFFLLMLYLPAVSNEITESSPLCPHLGSPASAPGSPGSMALP